MNKSTKCCPFIFMALLLLMAACQTTSSQEELKYTPGDVIIALENGIAESDIQPRIEELDLEWKEYFQHLGSALIGVPVGEEEMWIKKLKKEPFIRDAHLNRNVAYRGSK